MTGSLKIWETPRLVILVRNNPEDALQQLDTCKTGNWPGGGPQSTINNCRRGGTSELCNKQQPT